MFYKKSYFKGRKFCGFCVFSQIRKSFFREKSIIFQPQKFIPQNLFKTTNHKSFFRKNVNNLRFGRTAKLSSFKVRQNSPY